MRLTVILLAISIGVYSAGLARLWRNAGRDKGIRTWQAASFVAGWASLVIALVSPLDRLADILFSAHMTQHEILMIVAAPLLVVGRPLIAFLWALPPSWRAPVSRWTQTDAVSRTWRAVTAPLAATTAHALALWIWHVPSLYQWAMRDEFVHGVQHAMFFLTAALFWWTLIHGRYGRIGYGIAVFYVFLTTIHSGALGALLTFSPRLWYPAYEAPAAHHGVNALEDQQLAGLIMWIPAGVILLVLGLALFSAWLAEAEKRVAYTRSEILRREP